MAEVAVALTVEEARLLARLLSAFQRGELTRRPAKRYEASGGDDDDWYLAKITAVDADAVGRYDAAVAIPKPDTTATGDLVEADLATFPATENAIVWNLQECGATVGPMLAVGRIVWGKLVSIDTSGSVHKLLLLTDAGGGEDCT